MYIVAALYTAKDARFLQVNIDERIRKMILTYISGDQVFHIKDQLT